jgi:hypothetical protein
MSKGENIVNWIKGQRTSWLGHLGRMEDRMPKRIFTKELEGTRQRGKTQERKERGCRKRSSSAGSETMARVGDRYEKLEGNCSTGQSPQWAVVPMEEEGGGGGEEKKRKKRHKIIIIILGDKCRLLSSCTFLHSPATSSPLGKIIQPIAC